MMFLLANVGWTYRGMVVAACPKSLEISSEYAWAYMQIHPCTITHLYMYSSIATVGLMDLNLVIYFAFLEPYMIQYITYSIIKYISVRIGLAHLPTHQTQNILNPPTISSSAKP
jgi:hypothetical protein